MNLKINLALMLSAASGLIYEIVATNLLFFYFIRSSYSMAIVFSAFLFGLGIGSMLVYKFKTRIKDEFGLFARLQILIGIYSLVVLTNLTNILSSINGFGLFICSFMILLFPTILLGASFPLAGMIIEKNKKESIGFVYSIDLVGAVIGSMIAGFILIPILGNIFAIKFAVILNLLAAFIVVKWPKKITSLIWIAVVIASLIIPSHVIPTNESIFNESSNYTLINESKNNISFSYVKFDKPSPYGEVKIDHMKLFIDGREQCTIGPDNSQEGETTIVDYSLDSFSSRDIKVINIGLGCGYTLNRIVDNVDTVVDVVEINPVVVEANRIITNILEHDQVNLIVDEGLHYLRNTDKKYDSIIIDIENPSIIHASDIYTKESFDIIHNSLDEDGVFGLWTYRCGSKEYYDIIYYTLNEVFPYVYKLNDNNFIASNKILEYESYIPSTEEQINTLDKKPLSKIYFDTCKWW